MIKTLKNIDAWLAKPTVPISDLLARFNELGEFVFAIVVDEDLKPLGTVTDGDVRRGVLKGCSLNDPVRTIMNDRPVIHYPENSSAEAEMRLKTARFLPVVDETSQLVEIMVESVEQKTTRAVVIMCGGFGRRMGEMTKRIPKPLAKVGDKPMLGHILDWAKQSKFDDIFITTHYMAEQIREFADANAHLQPTYIHEETSLGTAGSIAELRGKNLGSVFVINGDVLTSLSFSSFDAFHWDHFNDCTLAVNPYQVKVPYGVVSYTDSGEFNGVSEKPNYTYFVASGMYILNEAVINLIPPNTHIDMPAVLNLARESGLKVGVFPIHEYWRDVGNPADLEMANTEVVDFEIDQSVEMKK